MLDRIEEPAATDGIAVLRDRNALIERPCARKAAGEGKIAHYPSVSLMIVEDITVALILAQAARRGSHCQEQGVVGRSVSAIERITALIKNLNRAVNRLDIVIRADIAIGVGRQTGTTTLR